MKLNLFAFVIAICCSLRRVQSSFITERISINHPHCFGSIDYEYDSCSVSAIFPQDKSTNRRHSRQKRQFVNDIQPICVTSEGSYGVCTPFQQCPSYFKITAQKQYQHLLMRQQDACTYQTSAGTQEIGVCCKDPQFTDPTGSGGQYPSFPPFYPQNPEVPQELPPNEVPTNEDPLQPADWSPPLLHPAVQWPPPLPTRPTLPPGPGKPPPPSAIYPAGTTPITKPPHKPATSKPPYKPPARPTQRPPSTRPTHRPPATRPTTKPTPTYPTTGSDGDNADYLKCGIKNGKQDQERIVGGHNAEPGEWPWMAAIMTNGKLFCGGSLIDNDHILTAAHCVAHMSPWDIAKMKIHLGDHNIMTKGDIEHVERKVTKVVRHVGFDPQTLYNDIAILTLDAPVKFSKNIRSICLPAAKTAYSRRMATVIGWGSLKEMGPTPGILQEVHIPIWENRECRAKYGPAAPGGIVDSFLCAGNFSQDSCSGDSGGPLMVNDGKWQQVGIVSWGIGCGKGQFPGVYTRITSYMSWLSKNLQI